MSQPALGGLRMSNSSHDNDSSSYSTSLNPPSPTSRVQPHVSPPVISLDDVNGVTSALSTASPTTPRSSSSRFPNPYSPTNRSVSFDVPREMSTPKLSTSPAPKNIANKRSFEIRRAVLNKNTVETASSSFPPPLPISNQDNSWSSVVDSAGVPKIEGLPTSNLGEATEPSWWKRTSTVLKTGDSIGHSRASSRERAITMPPTAVPPTDIEISRSDSPPPIPNYAQAAKMPLGQADPATTPTPPRIALLRLSSLPPSVFRFGADGGSARLSPSVVTRHPPLPIMSLPSIVIPETATSISNRSSHIRLRTMPALPMEGAEDRGSDHENQSDDDEDDNEDDHMDPSTPTSPGSENEDATAESDSPPAQRPHPATSPLPFREFNPPGEITPIARHGPDYFSTKPDMSNRYPEPPPTPTEWDSNLKRKTSVIPTAGSSRPGSMHRRASKSMVDLLSIKNVDMPTINEEFKAKGKGKGREVAPPTVRAETGPSESQGASRLKRQRSLPMFTEATDPPPYPEFEKPRPSFHILPREEEGMEKLPKYKNYIYLSAILPRKVEFTAPGVQSRDRKWRRCMCVLEGTVFKIYDLPSDAPGVSALGSWWERRVGVGDLTSTAPAPSNKRPARPVKGEEEQGSPSTTTIYVPPENYASSKKKRPIASSFLNRTRNNSGLSQRGSSIDISREEGSSRRSFTLSRPVLNTSPHASTMTASSSNTNSSSPARNSSMDASRSRIFPLGAELHEDINEDEPDFKNLRRIYTLQRAESGLASDYFKRKNVIRLRMEGEQFLLQAPSIPAVVEWIEVSVMSMFRVQV